ncbi:CD276 antigen-like isoform X2 [Erpetoichthys calabaricus]|uniref:CD276 antigen-like isoform X2 n=1 Tax=Erpetoichthys calabaricus TaxID=27687 RepID=UPI0022341485|nr:CD276 antigen-like isoform X2 [Erpetoichthys calabaricus]
MHKPFHLRWIFLANVYFYSMHLYRATEGAFHVSTPSSPVTGLIHKDVLLPCTFTDEPVDLIYLYVVWKHGNKDMVKYQYQSITADPRMMLFENELRRGNASLLLRNLTIEDEGEYTCEVVDSPYSGTGVVRLRVLAPPLLQCIPVLVKSGEETRLECQAKDFYPKDIKFSWHAGVKHIGPQNPDFVSKPKLNGSFDASSYYSYIPNSGDAPENVYCEVQHEALDKPLRTAVDMKFRRRAIVTVSPETLVKNAEQTLACKVHGYYPDGVKVTWLKDEEPLKKPVSTENLTTEEHHSVTVTNSTSVFKCQVEQEGFEKQIKKLNYQVIGGDVNIAAVIVGTLVAAVLLIGLGVCYWKKIWKASFSMSEIIVPSKVFVGEEVVLECIFEDGYNITEVAWFLIRSHGSREQIHNSGPYVVKTLQPGEENQQVMPDELTSLIPSDSVKKVRKENLKRGITTLKFVTNMNDHEGVTIQCKVKCNGWRFQKPTSMEKNTLISLLAYPVSVIRDVSVMNEPKGKLSIEAINFYPHTIGLHWLKTSESDTNKGIPTPKEQGLYSCSGTCSVSWEDLRDPQFIKEVVIFHPSLDKPTKKKFEGGKPGIHNRPNVSQLTYIPSIMNGHPCTLTCTISDFCPKDITVTWLRQKQDEEPILIRQDTTTPYLCENHLYTLVAELNTMKENLMNTKIILRVGHTTLKNYIERHFKGLSDS